MKHPFPPVVGRKPRVLVLSTFPSPASMEAGGYYGHPRNAFWGIMEIALDHPMRGAPWEIRYAVLRQRDVALWDVLAGCEREGSADAAIRAPRPNPVPRFLDANPEIRTVLLNGAVTDRLFQKFFGRDPAVVDLTCRRLPSTSPARRMPVTMKACVWVAALAEALR